MNAGRILVAGDSTPVRAELRTALEFEGHSVAESGTIEDILQRIASGKHDALLLLSPGDWSSAPLEPHDLCRRVRQRSSLGILVVDGGESDRAHELSAIDCLNAGADDYVTGPLAPAELMARVRAILRRLTPAPVTQQIVLQDRAIDLRSHRINGPGDRVIHLTPKEFQVLTHLVSNANKPLTHQNLAHSIWQRDTGEFEYVRVVIKQLRHKLEPDPSKPRYIHTERSVGYRFSMPAA